MNNKPKIFTVTRTPKGKDQILDVIPAVVSGNYCAVINVSDTQCATFDYQKAGIPSFWFPINEIGKWGHAPFFGALKVVNEYYKEGGRTVLIHCHAGANRSPSVAYAILLSKGYTEKEAEDSIGYENLREVFKRNIDRSHIPRDIVDFLKQSDKEPLFSIHGVLQRLDLLYAEWSQRKFDEQNDYTINASRESGTKLVYNKETKRFVVTKVGEAWVDPIIETKEWQTTPIIVPKK